VIKVCLGALTAVICILLGVRDIINGVGIGLIVYLGSDRVLKQLFIEKVEKQSVVTKTGIGIYIITWIFFWILIYTALEAPAPS
jgi:hypothetical protein